MIHHSIIKNIVPHGSEIWSRNMKIREKISTDKFDLFTIRATFRQNKAAEIWNRTRIICVIDETMENNSLKCYGRVKMPQHRWLMQIRN